MNTFSLWVRVHVFAVVLLLAFGAGAASVGPGGYTSSFSSQPSAADWATFSRTGVSGDVYDMDSDVNANISASGVTLQTTASSLNPPSAAGTATWSSTGLYLQTRPTNVRYTALMGKFVNNTGTNATQITVSYLFTITAGGVSEDAGMGTRVYFSLTGLANSWANVSALNVNSSTNLALALSANLSVNWGVGSNLYLLWVDDNGAGSPDPANQIDNFSLQVTAGSPPAFFCSLNSPTNNALFLSPASITTAAGVANGTAPYTVEYFTNSGPGNTVFASAGSSGAAPYPVNLTGLPAGTYQLYAVAGDSAVNPASTNSLTNTFYVVDPITLVLTAPTDGATFASTNNVSGTASVAGGTSPYSIQFYLDNAPNGAPVVSPPYVHDFGALFVGDHTVRAMVTDARGWMSNSLVSTIHISGPLAALLTPTNGTSYPYGQTVTLNAAAAGGTAPYTVTFYTNGQPVGSVGTAPFATNLGVLPVGTYASYVQVMDSSSPSAQQTNSTTNLISVLPNPLVVSLTRPTNGQTASAGQVFTLAATSAVGTPLAISNVEFFFDGLSVGVDSTAPYSASVTPSVGSHTAYAVATDSLGRKSYSVTNQMSGLGAPPNDNFNNAILLAGSSVSTTGNNFNATLEGSPPFPPPGEPYIYYSFNVGGASVWWSWTAPASGTTTIDTFGSSIDTVLAVYSGIIAYPNPSTLSLIASNDDSGSGFQSQVQFSAVAGTLYHITVDGYNAAQGSIALHIQGVVPTSGVTITSPVNNSRILAGVSLPVTANANSLNGTVSKVEFFVDGVKFGEAASSPYAASWSSPPLGGHVLSAVMTDSLSNSFTSAPVNITVLKLPDSWVAFNDPGIIGNPSDTSYTIPSLGTNAGQLRDITNGWALPAALTVTNSGVDDAVSDLVTPAAGTPAYNTFTPFISWGESVYLYATNTVGYVFSGLDPAKRYRFIGTAIRGGTANSSDYSNRWTQAELIGAASSFPTHSAGVINATQYPAYLSGNQVAWNAGYNNTPASGDIVAWSNIAPAPDGTFEVLCTKYAGLEPNGDASTGIRSYAFAALKLELLPPPDTNPPVIVSILANDLTTVVVSFSEPVDPGSATNAANYSFTPSLAIAGISLLNPTTVILTTARRDPQFDYALSVTGVQDLAVPANAMLPGTPAAVHRRNAATTGGLAGIQTVFFIIFENQDWSNIYGSPNAPYFNSILPQAAWSVNYHAVNNIHPSQPSYIQLEAGTNFGYTTDAGPAANRISSTNHLATRLNNAGIDWRGYMEDLPVGSTGVITGTGEYVGRHNPFSFFDDVTTNYSYCTNHVRPYSYFAADLAAGRIGRYNFLTPNLTNDMHDLAPGSSSQVRQGDNWLSIELPKILNSAAYSNNGAVFITFDESSASTQNPIIMIILSALAKQGYQSTTYYDHDTTVRTMQDIFGVYPYLAQAAGATNWSEMFLSLKVQITIQNGITHLSLSDLPVGKVNYVQASTDKAHWTTFGTVAADDVNQTITIDDPEPPTHSQRFYRVVQAP